MYFHLLPLTATETPPPPYAAEDLGTFSGVDSPGQSSYSGGEFLPYTVL